MGCSLSSARPGSSLWRNRSHRRVLSEGVDVAQKDHSYCCREDGLQVGRSSDTTEEALASIQVRDEAVLDQGA